jgi:putative thioredoxin
LQPAARPRAGCERGASGRYDAIVSTDALILDVDEQSFEREVIDASHTTPVVVDFWAAWCGPCRQLTPVLEDAVRARDGAVRLVKVDTDANPQLSASFGIRGIPAVKAFRDGRLVAEFTGAQPRQAVDRFLDQIVPSAADVAVKSGDEEALRAALAGEPRHLGARLALGRALLARGAASEAVEVLREAAHDPVGAGLLARAEIAADPATDPEAAEALATLDADPEAALERLLAAVSAAPPERKDLLRRVMIGIFGERGADDPLVQRYRKRLSAALY